MILVDTSVWIEHLRRSNAQLQSILATNTAVSHRFIIGEVACGHLKNRNEILALMDALPHAIEVEHDEALAFLAVHDLSGAGIGWIDIHLLASAKLSRIGLWTLDAKLKKAARRLDIAHD